MISNKTILFKTIENQISSFGLINITPERKIILQPLIDFIQEKLSHQHKKSLNLIFTSNIQKTHYSQFGPQTAAAYFNIENVFCYSGGTEATALFPMVAKTIEQNGFQIKRLSTESNSVYAIKYSDNEHPIIGFSKTFDDDFNPKSGFAAILTCSQADGDCPFIAGAEKRIPIPFEDPKVFDNTAQQTEKYLERSIEIATELFYVFSQIKNK